MNPSFGQMLIVLVQYLWNSPVEIIPSIFEYLWVVLCVLSQQQLHVHVHTHCTHTVHHGLDSRKCRLFSSCMWFVLSFPSSWPRSSFMTMQGLCVCTCMSLLGLLLGSRRHTTCPMWSMFLQWCWHSWSKSSVTLTAGSCSSFATPSTQLSKYSPLSKLVGRCKVRNTDVWVGLAAT